MVQIYHFRAYYRKESAAFLPRELNAKDCTSRQFSKDSPRFIIGSMAGLHMKPLYPLCFLHKFVSPLGQKWILRSTNLLAGNAHYFQY